MSDSTDDERQPDPPSPPTPEIRQATDDSDRDTPETGKPDGDTPDQAAPDPSKPGRDAPDRDAPENGEPKEGPAAGDNQGSSPRDAEQESTKANAREQFKEAVAEIGQTAAEQAAPAGVTSGLPTEAFTDDGEERPRTAHEADSTEPTSKEQEQTREAAAEGDQKDQPAAVDPATKPATKSDDMDRPADDGLTRSERNGDGGSAEAESGGEPADVRDEAAPAVPKETEATSEAQDSGETDNAKTTASSKKPSHDTPGKNDDTHDDAPPSPRRRFDEPATDQHDTDDGSPSELTEPVDGHPAPEATPSTQERIEEKTKDPAGAEQPDKGETDTDNTAPPPSTAGPDDSDEPRVGEQEPESSDAVDPAPENLTPEDISALEGYVGANPDSWGSYKELNEYLRDPDDPRFSPEDRAAFQARADAASVALEKLPPRPGTTYRGVDLDARERAPYYEGAVVTEHAFTSTTRNFDVATSKFDKNTLMMVIGENGRDVAPYAGRYASQAETLYDKDTEFHVVFNRFNPNLDKWIIAMKEVPRS